jgi:hypothetical protein
MNGERASIVVIPDQSGNATVYSHNDRRQGYAIGSIFWNGLNYAVEALSTAHGDPERTHVIGRADTFDQAVVAVARRFGPVEVRR